MVESSDRVQRAILVAGAASLALGVLIMYLSRAEAPKRDAKANLKAKLSGPGVMPPTLDWSKFTAEKLREFLKTVELDTYCIYARNCGIIQKLKHENKWSDQAKVQILADVLKQTTEGLKDIYEEQGLPPIQLNSWLDHYRQLDCVKDFEQNLCNLMLNFRENQEVLGTERLTVGCPDALTGEKYKESYQMIWKQIRHEMWKMVQEKQKEMPGQPVPQQDLIQICNEENGKFQSIRRKVYIKIMGDADISTAAARRNMQLSYLKNALQTDTAQGRTFAAEVQEIAQNHEKCINQAIYEGKWEEGIEKNPIEN